jgi:DNA-binding transcriptional LysR family regulator
LRAGHTEMDWDRLRVFSAAAEAGSFTKAGEVLGLSQSAVSRQISALERELKVPLFHRHARGLILTEQGELLASTVQDVNARLETARTMLTDSREKPNGELRVTTTVGLGSAWLTPRLNDFIALYPDIRLQLLLEDEELDIAMRAADVAIRLRQPTQSELIQRKLFTVHFHLYGSADYLRRHGTPRRIEDLDRHDIIAFGEPAPSYLREMNFLEVVGRDGLEPRSAVLRVNNVYGLKRAVQSGIGIAALPDYIIGEGSNLVQIPLDETELPCFDTYFVYPEELRHSARVQVFRDFLLGKAKQWSY